MSADRRFPYPFTIEEAAELLGVSQERVSRAAEIATTKKEGRPTPRGRPTVISQRTYERAVELRSQGLSLSATAEVLTAEGHSRGIESKSWTLTNVARLLNRRSPRQPHRADSSSEVPGTSARMVRDSGAKNTRSTKRSPK